MPTDLELLHERETRLHKLTIAQAAQTLAEDYHLSYDSVRGRLSRAGASKTIDRVKGLALGSTKVTSSSEWQYNIIEESEYAFEKLRRNSSVAVFRSDSHLPYARWDALALEQQLLFDIKPDFITVGNDLLDNAGFGRWEDDRPLEGQIWSGDFARRWAMEQAMYETLQRTGTTLVQVQGNHDNWFYQHLRHASPKTAEATITQYMRDIRQLGVLQFSRGYLENSLRLNPALVFWHGQFASKNPLANAKNTIEQFITDGVASSVVVGHTHRPVQLQGSSFGYSGVQFVNAPCLSRLEHVPYLKRDPKGWGLGLVVAYYDPTSRYHELHLIHFEERGNKLVARFNGNVYEVELDKTLPQDY